MKTSLDDGSVSYIAFDEGKKMPPAQRHYLEIKLDSCGIIADF